MGRRFDLSLVNLLKNEYYIFLCFKIYNSPVRIYGIRSVKYDSIKGQVLYMQTLTAQVEAPSLETSKYFVFLFFLVFFR